MPKLCEFYGIKIFMYWDDKDQHKLPHFHAIYNEHQAVFKLNGEKIIGKFPKTASRLVRSWALVNYEILTYAWMEALKNKPLPKIKGLK